MRAVLALLVALFLLPTPAHAEQGVPSAHFADDEVCVEVVDSLTGWHVDRAIEILNDVGAATLTRKRHCARPAPRVRMHRANKDNGLAGWAVRRWAMDWNGHSWVYSRADVTLNQRYTMTPCFNLTITVHEMGHALGLTHNHNKRSPMNNAGTYDWERHCGSLSQKDINHLRRLYP